MATIFKPAGRSIYSAKVRLWDSSAGEWVWKKVTTGCRDAKKAMAAAVALEGGSKETMAGTMTRAKAEALVTSILTLSGAPWSMKSRLLGEYGDYVIDAKIEKANKGSRVKYIAHWGRFKEWLGPRIKQPVENMDGGTMAKYYDDLLKELSIATANRHITTLRMIFEKARNDGIIKGNPAALVDKNSSDSTAKSTFTRTETARIVKAMRRDGRKDWALLTLYGWHTGHRLQDILSLNKDDVSEMPGVGYVVEIHPDKKKHIGGRIVVLPIPSLIAKLLLKAGDFKSVHGAINISGIISTDFIQYVKLAGIDPLPVKKKSKTIHLKTFHSFRHSMVSRLIAAGVQGETARLVTDHDSKQIHKLYTHAEIESLAKALKLSRGK